MSKTDVELLRIQLCSDIITTVIESGVSGFWMDHQDYDPDLTGDEPQNTSVLVWDAEDESVDEARKVTTDYIAGAFTKMRRGPITNLNEKKRQEYLGMWFAPEDVDFDANDADNILQVAMFTEIIYG